MERSNSPILKINDTFTSFQELRQTIERYEKANRVQFFTRDAKRLHRASPPVYQIVKDYPELEYCTIRFTCIHGGRVFKPKNIHAQRRSRGTWKQDCKAEIYAKLNEDKTRLIVNRVVEEHNHEIPSAEVFKHFPRLKRVAERRKMAKKNLVKRKVMKFLPKAKSISLEDIVRVNSLSRSNNLKKIANVLREKYSCSVDLQTDENDKVIGFFFQDVQMKKYFEIFPETLFLDGTYKLQNIGCCIYVLSIENSLGSSDVIGVGVLTVEDKASADWMAERFKESNPKWEDTTIVVTDRLTSEYQIALDHFPNAKRLICLSLALDTFKKDTHPSKTTTVTLTESQQCLSFFSKLSEAKSEEEYAVIVEDMEDNTPYPIVDYFYKNWHDLRTEWVLGLGATTRNFIKTKLTDYNFKLRSTIASCKTFSIFIEKLFLVLYLKTSEVKSKYGRTIAKVFSCGDQSAEKAYSHNLTTYACEKVQPHLAVANMTDSGMEFISKGDDSDVVCQTKNNAFVVSEFSCVCDFFTVMKLPCQHVLVYRKSQGLDLFDEYLFSQRWTRKYIQEALHSLISTPNKCENGATEKSGEEKFAEAEETCLSLATLCSEVPASEFEERMEVLSKLKQFWQNRDRVRVERVDSESDVDVFDMVQSEHNYSEVGSMDVEFLDDDDIKMEEITLEFVS